MITKICLTILFLFFIIIGIGSLITKLNIQGTGFGVLFLITGIGFGYLIITKENEVNEK